jgi:hypothetical protein
MRMAPAALAATCWAAAFLPLGAAPAAEAPASHVTLVSRFLDRDFERVRDYRALRRLEATNDKFQKSGWLRAWTELTPSGFRYEVVESGGSDYVRTKVLEAALKNEQRLAASGDLARAEITRANYEFRAAGSADDGLIKVMMKPRRDDQVLVDGALFLSPKTGDLIRVEGALAKNPSFWTKHVTIVREYGRIGGVRVPVRVESVAQVKIAGMSRFVMTYDYQRINGETVGAPGVMAERAKQ